MLVEAEADAYELRQMLGSGGDLIKALFYQKGFDWYVHQDGKDKADYLGEEFSLFYMAPADNTSDDVVVSYFSGGLQQERYLSVKIIGRGGNKMYLCQKSFDRYDVLCRDANNYYSICRLNRTALRLEDNDGLVRLLFYSAEEEAYFIWFQGENVTLELNNAVLVSEGKKAVLWRLRGETCVKVDSAPIDAVKCKNGYILIENRCWDYSEDNILPSEWIEARTFYLNFFWKTVVKKLKFWK